MRLGVDPQIVDAIADVESVKKNGRWYPFFIRVNNRKIVIKGLPVLRKYGNSVYDCINEKICQVVAKKLVQNGIVNIDLGAFQINYKYYKGNKEKLIEKAFNLSESYKIACKIVSANLQRHGYTLYAVALYHSAKKNENARYAIRILRAYQQRKKRK